MAWRPPKDAVSVKEAELSTAQRLGASEDAILVIRSNLAVTYETVGRLEDGLRIKRDLYTGCVKLYGELHIETLREASNLAVSLKGLNRNKEAKSLLRKTIPVARRVFGESKDLTLRMRWIYAEALYQDPAATLDDLREAVATLEDVERIARRVFGGAHPAARGIELLLRTSRAALRTRETPSPGTGTP